MINTNNHWLAGFLDSDGSVGIELSQPKSKKLAWTLRVTVSFCQKNPELIYLIAGLFSEKKVYKSVFKDGRTSFSVCFSSHTELPFWINYLTKYHLQSRKHRPFLKVKECFDLILEAKKPLNAVISQPKLTQQQKKKARIGLIQKAQQLQVELRSMEIPDEVREKVIPMYAGRFSLTLVEMDQIDDYLENSQLSFSQIAKDLHLSRDLLYRYRKNPDRYRAKALIDPALRRQNTQRGPKSPL